MGGAKGVLAALVIAAAGIGVAKYAYDEKAKESCDSSIAELGEEELRSRLVAFAKAYCDDISGTKIVLENEDSPIAESVWVKSCKARKKGVTTRRCDGSFELDINPVDKQGRSTGYRIMRTMGASFAAPGTGRTWKLYPEPILNERKVKKAKGKKKGWIDKAGDWIDDVLGSNVPSPKNKMRFGSSPMRWVPPKRAGTSGRKAIPRGRMLRA